MTKNYRPNAADRNTSDNTNVLGWKSGEPSAQHKQVRKILSVAVARTPGRKAATEIGTKPIPVHDVPRRRAFFDVVSQVRGKAEAVLMPT